jgi:O-antigen ligase
MVYIHIPTSIFLIKYLPDYGVQFNRWLGDMMWTGVGMQKNGLGVLCLLSAMLLAWTFVRRRQRRIPRVKYQAAADLIILGITLVLLRGPRGSYGSASGYSSTSIFALVVGFATFLRLLWMKRHGRYLGANLLTVIMALVIAFGTLLPIGIGFAPRNFTSALGRDATLTGRTDIWAKLMPVVEQRSMLGCGFGGFWTPETIAEHIVTEAHNGYLAVLMELGIVGLLLMTMFLLALGRKAAKILTYDFDWGSLCVCCFLMAVVHNISEASMNSFTTPLTAVLLLLSVGIPSRAMYQQMRKQESGVSGGEVSLNGQKRGNA